MLIIKWGWLGKKAEPSSLQVEDGEDDLQDPPIPKCGSGSVNDPTSSCDRWHWESKCKAIWDLVIVNGMIAVTVYDALWSFAAFTDGNFSKGISVFAVIVFFMEIFMNLNQVYRDENLKLQVTYPEICKAYAKSWLLIDLIALIPLDIANAEQKTSLSDAKTERQSTFTTITADTGDCQTS
jgi:hypothetical protein